jgi:hypothetical protein
MIRSREAARHALPASTRSRQHLRGSVGALTRLAAMVDVDDE